MLALSNNLKSAFFQDAYCLKMINAWQLRHKLNCDLDLADFWTFRIIVHDAQIFLDSHANIL